MSKQQQFCVYCGKPGLTHEHIFGDWLKRELPLSLPHYEQSHRTIAADEDDQYETVKKIGGDPRSRRPRKACRACNGGWMRDILEEARPYLKELVHGRHANLTAKAQKLIATWAVMTVMTGEFAAPEAIAVPQSDRIFLMENGRVPPKWRVWLGAFKRERSRLYWHHFVARAEGGGRNIIKTAIVSPNPANAHFTSFVMGQLYVAVLGAEAGALVREWRFPLEARKYLMEVWPRQRSKLRYPAKSVMDDLRAEAISDAFPRWAADRCFGR